MNGYSYLESIYYILFKDVKMGNSLTPEILRHFPKVELHRHLEGSYPLDKLYEIARKNHLDNGMSFEEFKIDNQFPKNGEPDFLLFLAKFRNHWYKSLQDISYLTYHSVLNLKNDGIFYIELRFNPEHFTANNNFSRKSVVKTILAAGNKAAKEIGLHIRYLITLNRGKHNPDELLTIYEQIKGSHSMICGFDLAGDETNYPPELFRAVFNKISSDGMYLTTVHAGEVSPPTQIWEAITNLKASRIGHGTSSILDAELQKTLIEKKILLEQCLTSNYQTGSWRDTATHPFGRLYRMGVPVALGSDDPSIQDADLTDDYYLAVKHFNFNLDDFITMNLNALNSAFLKPGQRRYLKIQYLKAVERFKKNFNIK